jgi:hypothetical protein
MQLVEEAYEQTLASLRRNVVDFGFTAAAIDHASHQQRDKRVGILKLPQPTSRSM